MPKLEDEAPILTLQATLGQVDLRALNRDKKLVIAFYIEDEARG